MPQPGPSPLSRGTRGGRAGRGRYPPPVVIVHREGETLVVVTQSDHARFAGELMSLWRADGLPSHPRRSELLFAVAEHDNGWWEADAVPRADPASGRPLDFLAVPQDVRFEVWRRGAGRFAAARPYASSLITHHALALHRERRGEEGWDDFLDELEARREEQLEAAGAERATVEADYRFLDLGDLLSLAACNRWRDPFERGGVAGRLEEDVLLLSPFPLAGATTFHVGCRVIPDRRYAGDADLGVELASARWRRYVVRLAP